MGSEALGKGVQAHSAKLGIVWIDFVTHEAPPTFDGSQGRLSAAHERIKHNLTRNSI